MEGFYEWIKGITYYLIFITVAVNLLPNKTYEKYVRFFAGMVLILLVLKPLTGGLRLDDKLAWYFESITFKKEAAELSKEFSKMEGQRLEAMMAQYEEAVAADLKSMAETEGFWVKSVRAVIGRDEKSPDFGHVKAITLLLSLEEEKEGKVEKIENVKEVEVEPIRLPDQQKEPSEDARKEKQEENSKLSGLRRRIAEYYDLEEQDIEIQMENG